MKLDVIITTYNRAAHCLALVKSLLHEAEVHQVIIVDAGEKEYKPLGHIKEVLIRSKHKNQPYQRYLGYRKSQADLLLYLDDDMEIIERDWYSIIKKYFTDNQVVAINIPFKNVNSFLDELPSSAWNKTPWIKKLKGYLTGYPVAKPNSYIYCGIRGARIANQPIAFLSGGSFAVKKEAMYINFNFQLFDLYEKRMGKGEDGILGYSLSKLGHIGALDKQLFLHNDFKDSSYSVNHFEFNKKVLFSRKYLTFEYYRLLKNSTGLSNFRFNHYAIFRIIASALAYIISPNDKNKLLFKGNKEGFSLSKKFRFKFDTNINNYWQAEATNELK
ncbi:MAG: glycosyltransferase [Chitinophagaceae bacterium]